MKNSSISGTGLALGLAAADSAALATPMLSSPQSELMPRGKQRRVVVIGGGWGGLSVSRHLRERAPDLAVVMLERNPLFWSCPLIEKPRRVSASAAPSPPIPPPATMMGDAFDFMFSTLKEAPTSRKYSDPVSTELGDEQRGR